MKRTLICLATASAAFALPALPAYAAGDMADMNMKPGAAMSAPKPVQAEVMKVDEASGRVTLRHGPIDNLGMGAMTMTFPVKDKTSLAKVRQGDKVDATFDKVDGVATVVGIKAR
ncbi:Cu and Ag efflux protein CusF [Cupriavidus sp. YR651]|uniref:copper-binding protein n=1 Tax=Cupriavidus sp. YR651 TaxID=1855315 RepID=UPI00088BFFF1|nr:copper-binding protein [Cupriavidus sp. YR651]SDC87135.1 Cu and Ag efflux protein CusF [Cupriavidus sp. YR651]